MEQMLVILCAVSASLAGGAELLSAQTEQQQSVVATSLPCPDYIVLASDSEELSKLINLGIQDTIMGYTTRARAYIYRALQIDENSLTALCTQLLFEENDAANKSSLLKKINQVLNQDEIFITPQERFYVESFLQLANQNIQDTAAEFHQRFENYRSDILSGCWASILYHYSDQAYTQDGTCTVNQKKALEIISSVPERHEKHPLVHYTRATIEENAPTISESALSSASYAASQWTDSAMAHHLYGHLLYKSNQPALAANQFELAVAQMKRDAQKNHYPVLSSFEHHAASLYLASSKLRNGEKWNKVVQAFIKKHSFHVEQMTNRGETIYRWEIQSFPLRSLLTRPSHPTNDEIKMAYQFASIIPGHLDDDAFIDYCRCLQSALQVRYLVHAKRQKSAEQALKNAQDAYNRLIVPRETYAQQSITYKLCFKRAIDAADMALNIAKMELYHDTADIWREHCKKIKMIQPHMLPPIIPQHSSPLF